MTKPSWDDAPNPNITFSEHMANMPEQVQDDQLGKARAEAFRKYIKGQIKRNPLDDLLSMRRLKV